MPRALGILVMGILLIAATPTAFGGWAVVTFRDVPEYLEAGAPTTLSFEIRQHGQRLLSDLSPSLTLQQANAGLLSRLLRRDRVAAVQGPEVGLYEATITPSDTGALSVTIDTDVFRWKAQLLPFRVVAAGEAPAALPAHERGRQLFAAKGCATCHAKRDDPAFHDWQVVPVGPDLSNRSYPADWLAQKLASPGEGRGATNNGRAMPALPLNEREIDALVHYLNRGQMTAGGVRAN